MVFGACPGVSRVVCRGLSFRSEVCRWRSGAGSGWSFFPLGCGAQQLSGCACGCGFPVPLLGVGVGAGGVVAPGRGLAPVHLGWMFQWRPWRESGCGPAWVVGGRFCAWALTTPGGGPGVRCWRVGPPVLVVLVIFGIGRLLANPSGGSWVRLPVFPRWGLSLGLVFGSSPFVAEGWELVFVGSGWGLPASCLFVPRAGACGARCVVRSCFRVFCVFVAPV